MTSRRRIATRAAGGLGATALAAAGLALGLGWPGAGHRAAPVRPLAPLVQPATTGGPSVANFCAVLRADTGHLAELGQARSPAQIVRVLSQYVAAAPAIAAEAPPDIAGPARLYVGETTAVYGAAARTDLRKDALTATWPQPFATPAGEAAPGQVRSYAEDHCGFDVFDPTSAAGR